MEVEGAVNMANAGDTFYIEARVTRTVAGVPTGTSDLIAKAGGEYVIAYKCGSCGEVRQTRGEGRVYACPECDSMVANPDTTRSECCGKFMRRVNPNEEYYCQNCEDNDNLDDASVELEEVTCVICSSCSGVLVIEELPDSDEHMAVLKCSIGEFDGHEESHLAGE